MKKTLKVKNVYGYSLLEMLVTLVVFAVLLTMIIQVLLLSVDSGRKIALRSKIRGDLSTTAVMIRRDFRNATAIDETKCGPSVAEFDGQTACIYTLAGNSYAWAFGNDNNGCTKDRICKFKYDGLTYNIFYETPESLVFDENITKFELEVYQVSKSETQGLLLATLQASPEDENAEIPSQVRQVTVFTRNF